jgi:hypothetical protein
LISVERRSKWSAPSSWCRVRPGTWGRLR